MPVGVVIVALAVLGSIRSGFTNSSQGLNCLSSRILVVNPPVHEDIVRRKGYLRQGNNRAMERICDLFLGAMECARSPSPPLKHPVQRA